MRIPQSLITFARVWVLCFWVLCIFVPLLAVLSYAGRSSTSLLDPTLLSILRATLTQALWSTGISGGVGLLLGVWIGRSIAGRSGTGIQTLLVIPCGVPTVVVGLAGVTWLGRSGILARFGWNLEWAYSLKAVVLAHAFLNIPFVALLVSQSVKDLQEGQIEAARTLGGSFISELRWIIWPQIRWAFASACAQVMAVCVMSFALVLILGGGPPVETLETALFARLRYGELDFSGAAACAFWELILTLSPWLLVLILKSKSCSDLQEIQPFHRDLSRDGQRSKWNWIFLPGVVFVLPYLVTVNSYSFLLALDPKWRGEVIGSLTLSLSLAGYTCFFTTLTALLAVICLHSVRTRPWIEVVTASLLNLPGGISVLVLGLGVWLAYGNWIDPFEGSFAGVVAIQTTLFFPWAFRILWPVASSVQFAQLESAALLGASPLRAFFQIEWSRWRGPVFSALAGVAGASLGEIGAVSLFYNEKMVPLPLIVTRWMAQYRFEEAQGIAGLLFLLSFLLIVGSFRAGNEITHPYASAKL